MELCEHVPAPKMTQAELCDVQNASSGLEALWKAAGEHAEASERHLAQVTQHLTVPLAKLAL